MIASTGGIEVCNIFGNTYPWKCYTLPSGTPCFLGGAGGGLR